MYPNKKSVILNIIIGIIVLFIQFNGIININIFGAMPFLPLGFALAIAMFSTEISAVTIGIVFGILSDTSSAASFGFNAIIIPFLCFFCSLTVHYLFNNNIRSCLLIELIFTAFYFLVRWILFYTYGNAEEVFTYFFKIGVPSALYTAVVSVLFYYTEKKLHSN